jgi:hypothetical protein
MKFTKRLSVVVLVILVASIMPAVEHVSAVTTPDQPTLFGMATSDWRNQIPLFTEKAGKSPALFQAYWTLESSWPQDWYATELQTHRDLGVTTYVELTTNDLAALVSGSKDAAVNKLVAGVGAWLDASPSHNLLIAPLPEANLSGAPWSGDPAGYKAGYLRIWNAFRSAGYGADQVAFVFSMNGWSSGSLTYDQFYPGDDFVEIIGFSRLNRNDPWRDYEDVFVQHMLDMQQMVSYTKPILVTQAATVGNGTGAKEAWLAEMFARLPAEDQIIGVIYFNRKKTEGVPLTTYDYRILIDGVLSSAVQSGYSAWDAPTEASWIFDGRMDAWVTAREQLYRFPDSLGSPFLTDILWMADQGITQGCAVDRFCPNAPVTRAQMATFLDRALSFKATSSDFFTDDKGSVHEAAINRMAAAGVTLGCGTNQYCPDNSITRAQMASFLSRALGLPATGTDYFSDDGSSPHQSNINRIAEAGVTLGCATGLYCPQQLVTRGQMAAFLHRALAPTG